VKQIEGLVKWQKEIQRVENELERCEGEMDGVVDRMYRAMGELDEVVESYGVTEEVEGVEVGALLEVGERLAGVTSAPTNFNAGDRLRQWHYPFPDEKMMSMGWLRRDVLS
jgi:hypothetical protein